MLDISFDHSSFSIDDLYNPQMIYFYSIYWDVTLIVTTFFLLPMLYVIIFKSNKEMGSYKWYLCHQLFWSYLFDLHLSLWKPIPLWPFYVGFSAGIYRNCSGFYAYIPLILVIFLSVGLGFSIYIAILHRYVQATPLSYFFKIYKTMWIRILHYIVIFVFIEALLCIPMLLIIPEIDNLKKALIEQNKLFEILFKTEPSMFGFDRMQNGGNNILILMFVIIAVLVIVLSSIFALYFNFLRILNKNRGYLCATTLKIQTALFRALCIQMFFAVVLLIAPITAAIAASIFGFKWVPKFSMCAIMVTAIHTLSDFTAIAYTIKSHRTFYYQLFYKFLFKLGIAKTPFAAVPRNYRNSISPSKF